MLLYKQQNKWGTIEATVDQGDAVKNKGQNIQFRLTRAKDVGAWDKT